MAAVVTLIFYKMKVVSIGVATISVVIETVASGLITPSVVWTVVDSIHTT